MTGSDDRQKDGARAGRFKEYFVGFGLGVLGVLYGAYALMAGATFLPGVRGGHATVTGAHGHGVAIAYILGGLFLFCRLFVEKHTRSDSSRAQLYFLENVLLMALIAVLVYVLLNVGTAG